MNKWDVNKTSKRNKTYRVSKKNKNGGRVSARLHGFSFVSISFLQRGSSDNACQYRSMQRTGKVRARGQLDDEGVC